MKQTESSSLSDVASEVRVASLYGVQTCELDFVRNSPLCACPELQAHGEDCLHRVVDKWLSPARFYNVHPIRKGRMYGTGERFVCIEASSGRGIVQLYFFRYPNGEWSVLPLARVAGGTSRLHHPMQ